MCTGTTGQSLGVLFLRCMCVHQVSLVGVCCATREIVRREAWYDRKVLPARRFFTGHFFKRVFLIGGTFRCRHPGPQRHFFCWVWIIMSPFFVWAHNVSKKDIFLARSAREFARNNCGATLRTSNDHPAVSYQWPVFLN